MAAGGLWFCLLSGLLYLGSAVDHNHQGGADTYHVSAGHLFLLRCQSADAPPSQIIWSRGDSGNEGLPTGVEVRDGLLWFRPVEMNHTGSYICEKRNETRSSKRIFKVLVSREGCPDPNEDISVTIGKAERLECKQDEIFTMNLKRKIRWMKDCHPLDLGEDYIYQRVKVFMRLPAVSEKDAGKYTCLIDITVDGWNYTSARSIQLTVTNGTPEVFPELYVVKPQKDVVIVQVGDRAELQCLAYVGFIEDQEIVMFWTINDAYATDYSGINETGKFIHERGKVYRQSILSISTVQHELLNVPIICHIVSPAEEKLGEVCLQEASSAERWLAAPITLLLLTVFFFICKVDLILAYRKLNTHFCKKVPDGKLYDAYVSVSQPAMLSLDSAACFALQILPEELEQKHGYNLYIRGRDDCPGEAVHGVITAAVHQCRRMIIILSSCGKSQEPVHFGNNQKHILYEQKVGLHDALMENGPKIILVEVDGPVDYSQLPESLRYIKRKQGALEWKNAFVKTNKIAQLYLRSNFWKNLRYHMPAVPGRRLQSTA
ncbi:interleukin-1 receptor-like 2 [Cyprinodon tularosa]|uniref:interleukin-1 receptor-like 2 n=1 Tax=Cyprinodon tularosa TaxID=77115 RepID=UPI0018E22173|nr:interleukin-1 receptor-like 2 [Cyprinodon tularosa]